MSLSSIPKPLRERVFARDQGACQYCGLHQYGQASLFHINHIIPKSRGGRTEIDNLVLQCPHCSLHKSNHLTAFDPGTGSEVTLFHPLRQSWTEQFLLEPDGRLVGRTVIGTATIERLKMNASLPLTARALQKRSH